MAGHNKWSKIKRQKAVKDGRKAANLAKLSKKIILAAKSGGDDPKLNFKLRTAIDDAKEAGMSKSTIEGAIEKGSGSSNKGEQLKEVTYEAYLPGGVALMIFAATDNLKRTVQDIKCILARSEGSLGSAGCVAYLFDKFGHIFVKKDSDWTQDKEEKLFNDLLELELNDIYCDDETEILITCNTDNLTEISNYIEQSSEYELIDAKVELIASASVEIQDEENLSLVEKAMDKLEDHEDILEIISNHT
ncbi:MAG: YebC/PmpR family DNA-binding transcriptional regulator [Candidatus Caenarcaniphilales bacterium]|nr:YebC/PmpR family DNA-binding transcriptional regulator [Candidatus Caenarcaniphilales bacterium]